MDQFYMLSLMQSEPRSTLFPYTTLFRSGQDFLAQLLIHVQGGLQPAFRSRGRSCKFQLRLVTGRAFNYRIDRKSTRLNSSHVATSYAVFCLKKKTKRTKEANN